MKTDLHQKLLKAIQADGRYPPAAYEFLHEGLAYTTRQVYGDSASDEPRHVTGRQLCEGLRDLALQRWGALARLVLNRWNIYRTRDFGEMVYFLIDLGVMGKRDSDRIEDFDDVYDFREAFDSYTIPLDRQESSE
jgi:uncharacterized repeat protein (TIGR04138 family)